MSKSKDDTNVANTQSQLLTGGYNSQVGVAKTFRVFPGDKVKVEAYAKYMSNGSAGDLPNFAAVLTAAFGVSSGSTGDALKAFNALNDYGGWVSAASAHGSNSGDPKGFVTILIFDKNFKFLDAAWDQIDDAYVQGPDMEIKDPFDYLTKEVTIKEEGYAYVFLSNEGSTRADIYFDDVTMTHTPSNIIQYNEYYPFGLQASTSWTRDNSKNNFLYNAGSEINTTTGLYDLPFRNYDAALGRFFQVDALAAADHSNSPFAYAGNNPVMFNDPAGLMRQYVSWQEIRAENAFVNMNPNFDYDGKRMSENWWYDAGGGGGANGVAGGAYGNGPYAAFWSSFIATATKASNGFTQDVHFDFGSNDNGVNGYWTPYSYVTDGGEIIATFQFTAFATNSDQQGGTAYVFGSDGTLIESHGISGNSVIRFGTSIAFTDLAALKQFVAIVAGESGNNFDEATAIAQVMMNRMNDEGVGLTAGFINSIGGTRDFDAIGESIYNAVMNSTLDNIFSADFAYATRVQGAMRALGGMIDITGGAYFWNATSQQHETNPGFNWNQYNNGTYVISASHGATTFFKYADGRTWP